MTTASTVAIRTHFTALWIALLGYASVVFLQLGGGYFDRALFVFPCRVLLVSSYILIDKLRGSSRVAVQDDGQTISPRRQSLGQRSVGPDGCR